MNYQVIISEAAESDIQDSFFWYKYRSESLAQLFIQHLDEVLQILLKNPNQFQERAKGLRVGFLRKFPFGVHYIIENKRVLVIGVFHTSRDPKEWIKRM